MAIPSWIEVKRKLSELKDYPDNPRSISEFAFKKLVNSLKEDGFHQRILIDTHNTIIGGHMRKKALLAAGYSLNDEISCLIPNRELTKEEFKRINLRDNILSGDFDFDVLSTHFEINTLIDFGIMPEFEIKDFSSKVLDNKQMSDKKIIDCPKCGAKIFK